MFGFGTHQDVRRKHLKSSGDRRQHRQAGMGYEKRLRFEPLEDRRLLSVFTVSNLLDGAVAKAGDLPGSLRQAIFDANANSGADTIQFDSSLNGGTITLTAGELAIKDSLTIDGPGATNLTISGNNQSRIFDVNDGSNTTNINVEIDGLKLTEGGAPGTSVDGAGGAIFSLESLTLKNCTITGNTAAINGGGIYSKDYAQGATTIQNCTITNNTAGFGGGIWVSPIQSGSALTIQDSTVSGNTANSANGAGAGAVYGGGGIYLSRNMGAALIQRCKITGNTSQYLYGGTVTGTRAGGVAVVFNWGDITFDSDTVSGNVGGNGGFFVRNSDGGQFTIENSTISGNTGDDGGGLLLRADGGPIVIQNSTISGNTATDKGGGVYTEDYVSITIQNSTITGNTSQGTGGGLYARVPVRQYYTPDYVYVHSAIIAGNSDASGTTPDVSANLFTDPYTGNVFHIVKFYNSLVGNNAGAELPAAPVGSPDANGNLVGTPTAPIDPKLGPLANNGGPTQTCALLAGSPAIDMGSNLANLTTDQRGAGFLREVGGNTDIGAYQYQSVVTAISPAQGPVTGDTQVTITGVGFTGATAVNFGSKPAASFTINSDTQITATSPAGAGLVDVTVVAAGRTSATSSADQFRYTPVVKGISPTHGPATGGTQVTITGAGFTGTTAVNFGNTPAAAFTVNSDTQITVTSPAGTGAVDVTVVTAGGTSATSSADQFVYGLAVTGLTPTSGLPAGGTQVTITGTGFTGATAVHFGGTQATAFTVNSDTQITATSPAGMGVVDVTVTVATATSATSSADQFTYAPVVTKISPSTATANGNTQVTITGAGFTGATAVNFGSKPAAAFTVNSDTQITVTSPAGAGVVDVTVVVAGGTSAKSAADQFSYTPVMTGINPTHGPAVGGTQVTISGAGFTGATAVNFGSVQASAFTVNSDGQITVTSPEGVGTVDVTVTTAGGTSATLSADQFSYLPVVTEISPAYGPAAGGTQVTITGAGFTGATAVNFGSTPAAVFTVNSGTQITATSPAGTGVVDVTVTVATTTSAKSSADQFSYAPLVTKISPAQGPVAGATQVTITGANFTGVTAVYFGATPAASFTFASDGQITATSPAGSGVVDVTVVTAGGTSAKSPADQFSYAPVVTKISPVNGPAAGGTQVTITGVNLAAVTAVNFGSKSAASFTINSDSQITAISPAGTGMVDVTAVAAGGTSAKSSADQFSYAPVVTKISPVNGPAAGGTQVTITGLGFTGAAAVNFGSTTGTAFTVNSDTQITLTSPLGTGLVDVTVVTASGTSAKSSADQFSYTPMVTKVSPGTGPVTGGTQVTITGVGFTGATAVHFGTVASSSFTVLSETQITAISPPGTGQVEITVTTAGGTSATPSVSDGFGYIGQAAITAVNATSGPTAGGTTVTITGTNMAGATAVKFGNSTATIQSDTATQIVVMSPPGTTGTVDLTVVTASGTSAIGPADQFTYYVPGICAIGLYNPSTSVFALRNCDTAGYATDTFLYGSANHGFIPIVGDWDGNGTETAGLYNPATSMFYLSNSNTSRVADITFVYGPPNSGDIPIVGDWNADGTDTIGLYDPKTSTFYLRNSNSSGFADVTFVYGPANSSLTPIVGDWYGGGKDTIGLYSPTTSTFYLRNSNTTGLANVTFNYGPANSHWTPVVGDWNADGKDSIGLYNPTSSVFYLRNTNEGGYANMTFAYGAPNSGLKPVVGDWMGDAQAEMAAQQVVASPDTATLTQAQLAPIVNEAVAQWSSAGLSAAEVQKLRQAQFVITDLSGSYLGETAGNVIYLDANAAGNGWFVDPTPAQNEEFSSLAGSQQLRAVDARALDRIDLLTVVEHELGHVLGRNDLNALADDVMDGVLGVGVRRLVDHVDAALAS